MFGVGPGQKNPEGMHAGTLFLQTPQPLPIPQVATPLPLPEPHPSLHPQHLPRGAREAASLAPASHTSPDHRIKAKGEVGSTSKCNGPTAFPMDSEQPRLQPAVKGLSRCPPGWMFCPAVLMPLYLPSSRAGMGEGVGSCSYQIPPSPCPPEPHKARVGVLH